METKNEARTPRKRHVDKKGLENSLDNRRCSEDASHHHHAAVSLEPDCNTRLNSNQQNPVLITKNKVEYQPLTSKNKGGKLIKIGMPSNLYTQSVDLAYYDNSKLKSNMVRKTKKNNESDGTYLPFISSEYANQEDRKRNPDEQYYKYERNLDRVGQDQMPTAEDTEVRYEAISIKQAKSMHSSKLPSIGKARHGHPSDSVRKPRERDRENEDKSTLVVLNSKPTIDAEGFIYGKVSSMTSSPLGYKSSSALLQPKLGNKPQKAATKLQEFKLLATPGSFKKKPEVTDDSRISNNGNPDNSFSEQSPSKEEGSDLNKSQNMETLLAVYRQSIDGSNDRYMNPITSSTLNIRALVHKKIEDEPSEEGEMPHRRGSLKKNKLQLSGSYADRVKDKSSVRTQKLISPSHSRKPLLTSEVDSRNKLTDNEEGQQLGRGLEVQAKGSDVQDKGDIFDLVVSSAVTHERSVERKNFGRYVPRQKAAQAPKTNLVKEPSDKESSDKPSNPNTNPKANAKIAATGGAKNAYRTISTIAKTNEKPNNFSRPNLANNINYNDKSNELFKYQTFIDCLYRTTYKYYVGKGNNGLMVRTLLKTRWWWMPTDSADSADINLCWTQLRNNNFIDGLNKRRKNPDNSIASANNLENSSVTVTTNDTYSERNGESGTEMSDSDGEANSTKLSVDKVKPRSSNTKKVSANEKPIDPNDPLSKVFTKTEYNDYINYMSGNKKKLLYPEDAEEMVKASRRGHALNSISDPTKVKLCNRMESNYHLSNKKALFYNMRAYYEAIKEDPFDYLPLTFHIQKGIEDKEYTKFLEYYNKRDKEIQEQEKLLSEADGVDKKALQAKKIRNIWIIKPGENTNRGQGIKVASELAEINGIITSGDKHGNGKLKTFIVQQYLEKPLLYNKRKFDIRCYMLVATTNGHMKGYWYQDGYIRTCSKEYSLKNLANRMVHLTNDAVQKKGEEYGKFENGNKLSYAEYQKYMESTMPDCKANFFTDVYPQMKNMARDTIRAVYGKMDPHRRENTFEIFGLDFMIDTSFKTWLIEVNTNPCLELSAPLLARIIPTMVENAFRLAVDPIFPPPQPPSSKKQMIPGDIFENNKFELIFDEVEDGPWLRSLMTNNGEVQAAMDQIFEMEEEAESDSEEIECP